MKITRRQIAALSLSASALVGIAGWETYRENAYFATEHERQVGVSTVGWGTTDGVRPGDKTTPDKALVRLLADASRFEQRLRACIGDDVEMTQGEWDSVVSWAYNVGAGAACSSTLVRKAKAGQPFCTELLRWTKQNGRELAGLVKRRQAEYRTCTGETL